MRRVGNIVIDESWDIIFDVSWAIVVENWILMLMKVVTKSWYNVVDELGQ